MRPHRLSIAGVMAGVAIIAINLAILRSLHAYDPDLDQGVALTWVAVQYGAVRSARSRGRGRAAWFVFVAAGSAAMLSFAWCLADQGSTMFWLWSEYTRHSNRWLNRATHVWDFYNRTRIDAVCVVVQAVAWSAPQLAIAASVGVATRSLSAWRPGGRAGENGPRCDALASSESGLVEDRRASTPLLASDERVSIEWVGPNIPLRHAPFLGPSVPPGESRSVLQFTDGSIEIERPDEPDPPELRL